jgi:hypothetical protein
MLTWPLLPMLATARCDPSGPKRGTALVAAHLAFEQLCLLAESIARRTARVA